MMMIVTRLREKVVLFPVSDPNNKLTFVFLLRCRSHMGCKCQVWRTRISFCLTSPYKSLQDDCYGGLGAHCGHDQDPEPKQGRHRLALLQAPLPDHRHHTLHLLHPCHSQRSHREDHRLHERRGHPWKCPQHLLLDYGHLLSPRLVGCHYNPGVGASLPLCSTIGYSIGS